MQQSHTSCASSCFQCSTPRVHRGLDWTLLDDSRDPKFRSSKEMRVVQPPHCIFQVSLIHSLDLDNKSIFRWLIVPAVRSLSIFWAAVLLRGILLVCPTFYTKFDYHSKTKQCPTKQCPCFTASPQRSNSSPRIYNQLGLIRSLFISLTIFD